MPPLKALWTARRNLIAVWPDEAFAAPFLAQRFLFRWLFVANSPEAVRHVMVTNGANYFKSRQMQRALEPLVGNGVFISNGETWRQQRRMATPAFHHTRLRGFAEIMTRAAADVCDRWAALGEGGEVEVGEEMSRVTAGVVCRAMFTDDLGEESTAIIFRSFAAYQDTLSQVDYAELLGLPGWLPSASKGKARRAAARIHREIDGIVARRKASGEDKEDLLSIFLKARDDETGQPWTDRQIRDEVSVMFLAGHETTASSLGWAFYLLSQHPEVEARLHAEVDAVLGGRVPAHDDVARLPFTRQVFEEALRLYPPVAVFSREAQADDEILGRPIPAGSMVLVVPWLLHRHRALWRDPDRFDPDRFSPERSRKRPKHAYVPFGAGPRTCLGASFAMTEAVIILAAIAQRFRLRMRDGHPVEPVCRLTLRPRFGLPMRLEPRPDA
jgi:cytochrome P450